MHRHRLSPVLVALMLGCAVATSGGATDGESAGGSAAPPGSPLDPLTSRQEPGAQPRVPAAPVQVATGRDAEGGPRATRALTQPAPWGAEPASPFATRSVPANGARSAAVQSRAAGRAYPGAPPVIPHSATFGRPSKTCLDCHWSGFQFGDRVAPPVSHPPLRACTQCHVESRASDLPAPAPWAGNSFRGHPSPGAGARAGEGAPPAIPHGLLMRTRCLACHGSFALPGLRTSHPERASCTQCHLEQDRKASGNMPLRAGPVAPGALGGGGR